MPAPRVIVYEESDWELVQRYRAGDRTAFTDLMTRYHDEAVRAEELFQQEEHKDRPGERFRYEKVWQSKVWARK